MVGNSVTYDIAPALDPEASVFVSANAGAGKTRLLAFRVLRLLLHGVPPHKILCLTFTHAAAAEMTDRVLGELGRWVMASETDLLAALKPIIEAPDNKTLVHARSLFATVLEAPVGLRIQTIHGFCQSLLKRFPIESGVSPHFSVMDARSEQEMLQEARLRLFSRAQREDENLRKAISAIARQSGEMSFHALMQEIVKHKRRFQAILTPEGAVDAAVARVWKAFQTTPGTTPADLIRSHFSYDEKTLAGLRQLPAILLSGEGKADKETGQGLADWLEKQPPDEAEIMAYIDVFMTREGKPRKVLFTKKTLKDAEFIAALMAEQERVWRFADARRGHEAAQATVHMLHIAESLLALYDAQKRARALMDYDDLILNAQRLLQKPGIAPWVLFKLDGGINHVLVDEAQDTSAEQWSIIRALTEEFFSGEGRSDEARSLFVVGDEKQSIYSFQGADPAQLSHMRKYFLGRIEAAAMTAYHLPLVHSYRSTREVLSAVDAVFAQDVARDGLMAEAASLTHIPTRDGCPGLVELWPLLAPPANGGNKGREDSSGGITHFSPATQLAQRIAGAIRGWIDGGTARPGDIMILVRTRTSLVDKLVRALKRRGVPVAGHDRMRLGDNLAVRDLIALGQCLLLPDDDLTLASLLKSPICNISEEDLFQLAYNRGEKSLWERLQSCGRRSSSPESQACALLSDLRARADYLSPYELYSTLLETLGARKRFTGRMGEEYHDPIDEFLGQALLYEKTHPPSLQGFLHWLASGDSEIKRDMEQAGEALRILTIHGAKGLQAPVVILPDTTSIPAMKDSLLWRDGTLPLRASPQGDDALCASLRDAGKQAMMEEYRRLLYVALTRAEDRLYICGATGKDKISDQCWYSLIKSGLEPMAASVEMEGGKGLRVGELFSPPLEGDRLIASPKDAARSAGGNDFSFLLHPAPAEPVPPRPLAPSRLADAEPPAASPLAPELYQRGNLIHKLLQHLPALPETQRLSAAQRIAGGFALSPEEKKECIAEALAVIRHPDFSFLFGADALAEAPVAGCVEMGGKNVAVAGQIDRLHVGEREVWIVDFKSNRRPPESVPPAYLRQMQLYRRLLARIYPEKTICCGLLWTATAKITTLTDALLDETSPSS
ncbi:MAG: double-strand break repair helicase AddA [Pseudomonadota bacterium]|nr:double-strand break repair helicase AddA [Pseudomonadota bacterium]MDE3038118.1 double-strand break repair helicase AddA [Pseudomonadota bacterium]